MSLPKYSEYQDSGVEWLGRLPRHWTVCRLKAKLALLTERAERRSYPVALENIESWSGRFVVTEGEFEGDGVAFSAGDILFGKLRPYLAKVYLAERAGEAVGDFHILRPAQGMHGRFVQYQLLSHSFINVVDGSTFGSKMPRASWETLGNMPLIVPPSVEQIVIAAFLDRETAKIDALIAEQEKLITLLAKKRQATIFHAVTRGLDPGASMKDSGVAWLGEVPSHWSVRPLKFLVELRSGGTPSKDNPAYWNGDVPWASAKDLKVEQLASTADCITEAAVRSGAVGLVPAGAVLVVVRGMILARTFPVVETLVPMAINQDLKAVIPMKRLMAPFLAWLLRGSAEESLRRLDEAGHGTKALRMDAWVSMQLPVPPFAEQVAIAEFLSRATARVETLRAEAERAIALLGERRRALIVAAVTGQIDVRGTSEQPTQLEELAA